MVDTVCVNTVALVDTLTTATVYCVAPVEAFQLSVAVADTVGPGGEEPPGVRPVGVVGAVALLAVKSTPVEGALLPVAFSPKVTSQRREPKHSTDSAGLAVHE